MPSRGRSAVAPLYLLACLILGGSAQGIWANMVLQLAGLAIIAWAAAAPVDGALTLSAKLILLLAVTSIGVVVLQSVPLPPALWAHGARTPIAEGYRLLGERPPALPISLTPYESLDALLRIIPPLAIFCAMVRLNAYRMSWLTAALMCGTIAGIMLGALQVLSTGPSSLWYVYPETSVGLGVGFFASANHMADLLVFTLPFVAALASTARARNIKRHLALLTMLAGIVIILLVGIALNGSLAGYALAVPVLASSALIVLPSGSRWRRWLAGLAALSMLASLAGLASSSVGVSRIGHDASGAVQSRQQILATTSNAIADYMPLGSGLGSFVKVYRLYESPASVTNEDVVHAYNDYAELALELGVPGVILLMLFFSWWLMQSLSVWRKGEGTPWARAASIASAAVLVHSLMDFPLRTAAISAGFAMCLALLAHRPSAARQDASEFRPTRHVVIG